jgi:hypothetical protein
MRATRSDSLILDECWLPDSAAVRCTTGRRQRRGSIVKRLLDPKVIAQHPLPSRRLGNTANRLGDAQAAQLSTTRRV